MTMDLDDLIPKPCNDVEPDLYGAQAIFGQPLEESFDIEVEMDHGLPGVVVPIANLRTDFCKASYLQKISR